MDEECEGSGREVPAGPPPDEATTCPACGRETKVDGHEVDGEMRFTIARHEKVVKDSS